jgi:hypothetical protein
MTDRPEASVLLLTEVCCQASFLSTSNAPVLRTVFMPNNNMEALTFEIQSVRLQVCPRSSPSFLPIPDFHSFSAAETCTEVSLLCYASILRAHPRWSQLLAYHCRTLAIVGHLHGSFRRRWIFMLICSYSVFLHNRTCTKKKPPLIGM